MAPTDRYVFAKVTPCACGQTWGKDVDTALTDIPAPDPADWQKVVEAVRRGREAGAADIAVCITAGEAAVAAVRNMEARS